MKKDLHELPKMRDSISHLYVEHVKIEQEGKSICCYDQEGKYIVPCASLALLMLGPGISISHEAIKTLADNGCLVIWSGEEGVRFYAHGMGKTRSAKRTIHQAAMVSDPNKRLEVVKRLYRMRFKDKELGEEQSLEELRGIEGVRVRSAYARASRENGVIWRGRSYKRDSWKAADPANRALSCANACLYGICHAGIVTAGYTPALGFIHTGKQLSFVYDIADLYKTDISIPVAFQTVAESTENIERRVRTILRDYFRETKILSRIIEDIDLALMYSSKEEIDYDSDAALPTPLWNGKNDTNDQDRE